MLATHEMIDTLKLFNVLVTVVLWYASGATSRKSNLWSHRNFIVWHLEFKFLNKGIRSNNLHLHRFETQRALQIHVPREALVGKFEFRMSDYKTSLISICELHKSKSCSSNRFTFCRLLSLRLFSCKHWNASGPSLALMETIRRV